MSKKLHVLSWVLCILVGFSLPPIIVSLRAVLCGIREAWVVLTPSLLVLAAAIFVMVLLHRRSRLAEGMYGRIAVILSLISIAISIFCRFHH